MSVLCAYWNSTMVSLHPTVVYFKDGQGNLQHNSFIYASDELFHDSTSVFLILKKFIPELRRLVSLLKSIHYWTDSPTPQYQTKTIFGVIATHEDEFGFPAVWNYFETGHGKGPCDGVVAWPKECQTKQSRPAK